MQKNKIYYLYLLSIIDKFKNSLIIYFSIMDSVMQNESCNQNMQPLLQVLYFRIYVRFTTTSDIKI